MLTSQREVDPIPTPEYCEFPIPDVLRKGMIMTKISEKGKQRRVFFKLDPDEGTVTFESKKFHSLSRKSVRAKALALLDYGLKCPEHADNRWITIIYVLDGAYKMLHMVADTPDVCTMWDTSLRRLLAIRQGLMTGIGNLQLRESIWERQYWKGADVREDRQLSYQEVEWLCWKLNANIAPAVLRTLFDAADTEQKGFLNFSGFKAFVKSMKRRPDIESIFSQLCNSSPSGLSFEEFKKFMFDIQKYDASQEQLRTLFAKHSDPSAYGTRSEDEPVPASSIMSSVPAEKVSAQTLPPPAMSLEAFSNFLLSDDNSVFPQRDRHVWQDMTRPISEYYISSSHNTYLVGNQLTGVSTVEGYIRALLHSCRTVEVDIYDGYEEPVVFHGKTLTSSVPLRDICVAIAKYAFVTSPYPVIISAEVHCGVKQQERMVEVLTEVFGASLVRAPEEYESIKVLPSPESLKKRVLLKAKNLYLMSPHVGGIHRTFGSIRKAFRKLEAEFAFSDSDSSDSEPDNKVEELVKGGLDNVKRKWRRIRGKDTLTASEGVTPRPETRAKIPMSVSLVPLIVYTVGVKFTGFDKPYAPQHVFSLSESAINRLLRAPTLPQGKGSDRTTVSHIEVGLVGAAAGLPAGTIDIHASHRRKVVQAQGVAFVNHTRGHVVRTYPKGMRFMSENYLPHRFWAIGAQVVALNWQTFDLGYAMNMAMFLRNGRAGYILKPQALRPGGEKLLNKWTHHVLDITVISAQQLPSGKIGAGDVTSIVDPFVQVTVHVPDWKTFIPNDASAGPSVSWNSHLESGSSKISQRTRVVKRNGFNPVWQETMSFPFECVGEGTEMRDLIFVQFSVKQDGSEDEYVAGYCTPLGCLEMGFRYLPLHDLQQRQYLFSTLFVRIDIRDVI